VSPALHARPRERHAERREFVVIMSAEDLESLEATIELLSDPVAQGRIAQSEAEIAWGEVVSKEEMLATMKERRRSGR
jgi:hypothetical protein